MKKILFFSTLCLLLVACNAKEEKPMTEADQQSEFKTIAENILDGIDKQAIQEAFGSVMELSAIDVEKYSEGKVIEHLVGVLGLVKEMEPQQGKIYEKIYALDSLRGNYTFVGGKQIMKESSNIEVNYENTYYATVVFSSKQQTVLVDSGNGYKIYAQIPVRTELTLKEGSDEMIKMTLDLETNVTDITNSIDFSKAIATVSAKVDFAGYSVEMVKVGLDNRQVSIITNISKSGVVLFNETLAVSDVEFDNMEPCGAKKGSFELDLLGKMQVKVGISDITAFIAASEMIEKYRQNEVKFKEYVGKLNGMMDTGIYFSSDVKQSWLELYPYYYEYNSIYYNYSSWSVTPVFVLADGTRYEDINDFFNETYFRSVITKFEELENFFYNLF